MDDFRPSYTVLTKQIANGILLYEYSLSLDWYLAQGTVQFIYNRPSLELDWGGMIL